MFASNRPERAQYLAQGKAYSPPPWVNEAIMIFSRPARARDKTVQYLAPSGRLNFVTITMPQGGAEYRLPWARYDAPSGWNLAAFTNNFPRITHHNK